ncbi:MAG: GDSL-type esterase/lipase family protein [Clostridia bacterium]|nr:GDSL-type esterase/lipase family protein [Clostridia bacterium]
MKIINMRRLLCLLLGCLLCLTVGCTQPGNDDPADTAETAENVSGTDTEAVPATAPDTEPPTEAPTEPETEAPLCTVSFVNGVGETVPPAVVRAGETLAREDIRLPEGTVFADGDPVVYPIPSGVTFDGDLSRFTKTKLSDFIVTEDVTLALALDFETTDSVSLSDTSVINYYGRNYVTDEKVTFLNTSAGFEVRFYGSVLAASFSLRAAGPIDGSSQVFSPTLIRLRVYKDGNMDIGDSDVITIYRRSAVQQIVLAEFEEYGYHTVLIRKMNYDFWGYLEMTDISCDGGFTKAPPKPEKKMLVYGDSITVGFGIEYRATGDVGGDVPEKEDGTRTYAALLADRYGTQLVEYCNTGVSVGVPCWRETAIMQKDYWKQYAYFDTGSEYDMQQYVPDLIICNLGTNDNSGLVNGASNFGNGTASVPADYYKPADLQKAYADFISVMKQEYPDAAIIIAYGMMGTGPVVNQAIKAAVEDCGFDDVWYLNLQMVELSQNAGHPTLAGHEAAYKQLYRFIDLHKILG